MCADKVRFETENHPLFSTPSPWRFLSHYSSAHEIAEVLHLDPSPEEPASDLPLAERVLTAYRRALDFEGTRTGPTNRPITGIWEMVKYEFHGEFCRLVAQNDVPGFAAYMRNAMRESLTHGLGPGHDVFKAMSKPGLTQNVNVQIIIDRLASLAEAVGALPCENPEQGRYGVNVTLTATDLVNRIEAVIGAPIGRGPAMGNFGIRVNEKIIDVRTPDDAYTIFQAKKIAETRSLLGICEIGGGLGGNAIQALRMGLPSYTIFDIPIVCAVQAWFLIKSLGPETVELFGETHAPHKVAILPYWEFYNRSRSFSLVINRDSIPEIPIEHARSYLAEIAAREACLLSINQESAGITNDGGKTQLCVGDLVREIPSMRRISRYRAWIREGYVEELFVPA